MTFFRDAFCCGLVLAYVYFYIVCFYCETVLRTEKFYKHFNVDEKKLSATTNQGKRRLRLCLHLCLWLCMPMLTVHTLLHPLVGTFVLVLGLMLPSNENQA